MLANEPTRALLFPGYGERGEAIVTDFRKVLDKAAIRAGFSEPVLKAGEPVKDRQGRPQVSSTVKVHMFRHTFCAARLQTLDSGAPVSPFTVSRELGHGSRTMVEEVYSHLGTVRHRSEVVEYRVEQHEERLRERLSQLEGAVQ